MEAPARRPRARLRAALAALATAGALLFTLSPAVAYAEPDPAVTTEAPTDPPATSEPPSPTAEPTTEAPPPPPPPPPPPTTEAPPPAPKVHRFAVTVSDVVLGDAYWQGDGSSKLVITVQNTGEESEAITGFYAFPSGTQALTEGSYATEGCQLSDGTLSFKCVLAPGKLGYLVVKVEVSADAWRLSGAGIVTTQADGLPQKIRNFAVTFSTKPPVPGIELTADPLNLPAQANPKTEAATLQVRLRNTGSAKAGGAIEVVTPPGVDVVTFPAACKVKRRIAADRDRCEFGDIAAGKDVSASFGLTISAGARAVVPLTGAVHGYLTPIGRDTVETRTDYQITGPPVAGDMPLPTEAPASPTGLGDLVVEPAHRSTGGLLTSQRLSSLPFVGGIVGLVALVGFLVVFSLRRRLRDESPAPAAVIEDKVIVPAQRPGDDDLPPLPPRSPIPRALMLPRLPSGPVAGSRFRQFAAEEDNADGEE